MGNGVSEVMVVALMFAFVAAAFVVFFYIFTRHRWSSNAATARARVHVVFAPDNLASTNGLDLAVVRSLPVLICKVHGKGSSESMECSVCLSELLDGEKVRLLPKCNHWFHLDCIDKWFISNTTCPLCRKPVEAYPNDGSLSESLQNLPANVLFGGCLLDRNGVCGVGLEGSSSACLPPSSSSSSSTRKLEGVLVIDVPSSTLTEEEAKSPAMTSSSARLKSFRRLLSREKKVVPESSCSGDAEYGGRTTDGGD